MLPQYCINHDDVILLIISKKSVTLARLSEKLPDDGHRRPKIIGAILQYFIVNFSILHV
jgi:hypothetical protein